MSLVACSDFVYTYVPGEAEPIEVRVGADVVTYCADAVIAPEIPAYIDHSQLPDASVDALERLVLSEGRESLYKSDGPDPGHGGDRPIACREAPHRPFDVYMPIFGLYDPKNPRPRYRATVGDQDYAVYGISYTYFARDNRVFLIDARATCANRRKTSDPRICFSSPEAFQTAVAEAEARAAAE